MWQEPSQGGTLTGPLGYMFTLRQVQAAGMRDAYR